MSLYPDTSVASCPRLRWAFSLAFRASASSSRRWCCKEGGGTIRDRREASLGTADLARRARASDEATRRGRLSGLLSLVLRGSRPNLRRHRWLAAPSTAAAAVRHWPRQRPSRAAVFVFATRTEVQGSLRPSLQLFGHSLNECIPRNGSRVFPEANHRCDASVPYSGLLRRWVDGRRAVAFPVCSIGAAVQPASSEESPRIRTVNDVHLLIGSLRDRRLVHPLKLATVVVFCREIRTAT